MIIDLRGREDLNPDVLAKYGIAVGYSHHLKQFALTYMSPDKPSYESVGRKKINADSKKLIVMRYAAPTDIQYFGSYIEAIYAIKNNVLEIVE